jgi:hypothetical protein
MSVIAAERFYAGQTYETVRDRIIAGGGIMQDLMEKGEAAANEATLDLSAFEALPEPLYVLALSEDWCGDCTDNLPIVHRIATETGRLDFRILSRDENLDIMDRYLKYGEFRSIPLIIFMDRDFNEIGHLKERPESVTERRKQARFELYERRPELGGIELPPDQWSEELRQQRFDAEIATRESLRGWVVQEVVRELSAIVAGALARPEGRRSGGE